MIDKFYILTSIQGFILNDYRVKGLCCIFTLLYLYNYNTTIKKFVCTKLLGIDKSCTKRIDKSLSRDVHIDHVSKRFSTRMFLLSKLAINYNICKVIPKIRPNKYYCYYIILDINVGKGRI